uniref:PGG domain-containing protein n=1 Tax=Oryza punctata TaxID=4537 RepID=A0A0E0MD68_ORYPU
MDHHVVQLAQQRPGSPSADQTTPPPPAAAANGEAPRMEMCPSLYRAARSGRSEEVMALLLQQRHGAGAGLRQVAGIIQHEQCNLLEVMAERNTVLHVAAEKGHGELIQELYRRFINDNCFLSHRNSVLDTPLHCAARAGHTGAMTILVHLAQDNEENILGCQNTAGDTALHLAARHGHGATVKALVAARAKATELNKAGVSPLYLAVMSRSVPAVRAIVTTCSDASPDGPSSENALHAAVFRSLGIIQHEQCNLLEVMAERNTVLHVAAEKGHGELIQELYRRFINDNCFLSHRNSVLDTPLHCAARAGHTGAMTILVHLAQDNEENILGCQNTAGDTALHLAARHGHGATVKALVAARAKATELNKAGVSPLYLAVMSRSVPAVRAIVTTCSDASPDGPSSENALHAAVFRSLGPALMPSSSVTAMARPSCTPRAVREKRSSVVSLAIKKHKQVSGLLNAQDGDGKTPLHIAVVAGAPGIVNALLQKGKVQTDVLNDDGHTTLDLASTSINLFNMVSFVVTLLAFGAQGRPQRNDHLKPWKGRDDIGKGIERTSDSLAVVAVLIATVAFAAGFNMPGGYGDNVRHGVPRGHVLVQVVHGPGRHRRSGIGGGRDAARLREGVALHRLVEELRGGVALHPFAVASVYNGLLVTVINSITFAAGERRRSWRCFCNNGMALEQDIVKSLHGQCDLLEVTAERNTILHVAAEKGHGELIQELYHRIIKDNGFLSRRNSALDTPLHCAARAGHTNAVTILVNLAQDSEENILGCQNAAGDTALHLASRHGHGATVEALVAARAMATELNKAGVSPLYLAVMSRSVPAVRAIVSTCSEASPIGPSSQNALHAAVFRSLEMVHLLLQWKPELASQVDCNGSTPLHFAASNGNHRIVRAILATAPPDTVYMKDLDGISALHVAARLGHVDIVKQLFGICPDAVELRDGHGETFLHTAVREKRSSIVSLAIKKHKQVGGLLDAQDGDGNTPLHIAVVAGSPGIVHTLLHKGKVQSDVLNNDGHTPLDLASTSTSLFNMVKFVVALVAFGAQGRPQRNDHLKPWSGRDIGKGIERTSDSFAVVAGLITTAAFAAGFNMPGGYGDDGTASLKGRLSFKWFIFLDAIGVAASVVAVILLVYGKASRSAGSWKSFVAALHCMWVSLVSLILAFFAASRAVMGTLSVVSIVFMVIYVLIIVLATLVARWVEPVTTTRTLWRFVWLNHRAHAVRRQYPFAVASVYNCLFFSVINFIIFVGLGGGCNL